MRIEVYEKGKNQNYNSSELFITVMQSSINAAAQSLVVYLSFAHVCPLA